MWKHNMKLFAKLRAKSKPCDSLSDMLPYQEKGATISKSDPITGVDLLDVKSQLLPADVQDSKEWMELPPDLYRHNVVEQLSLIEAFEREKEELQQSHEREKSAIKRAYENERRELMAELSKSRELIETNYQEIRSELEQNFKEELIKAKDTMENDLNEQRRSLREQWALMGDIEIELQRIGTEISSLLRRLSPEEATAVDAMLQAKLAVDKSCLASLRKVFMNLAKEENVNQRPSLEGTSTSEDSTSSKNSVNLQVKGAAKLHNDNEREGTKVPVPIRDLELTYNRDLDDLANLFRQQKTEIMEMFAFEKEELAKQQEEEKQKLRDEIEMRHQMAMDEERKEWQDTILEYQREIDILRFQREQMDRNYCVEIDQLKSEMEGEKVALYKKFMKERDELKRTISDKLSHALFAEVQNKCGDDNNKTHS